MNATQTLTIVNTLVSTLLVLIIAGAEVATYHTMVEEPVNHVDFLQVYQHHDHHWETYQKDYVNYRQVTENAF